MYMQCCYAGFPMPVKAGKFEVWGVRATVNTLASASRLTILDDDGIKDGATHGRLIGESNDNKKVICDLIGVAAADAYLCETFPEPIKTRRGISVSNAYNLVGGRTILFVR